MREGTFETTLGKQGYRLMHTFCCISSAAAAGSPEQMRHISLGALSARLRARDLRNFTRNWDLTSQLEAYAQLSLGHQLIDCGQ